MTFRQEGGYGAWYGTARHTAREQNAAQLNMLEGMAELQKPARSVDALSALSDVLSLDLPLIQLGWRWTDKSDKQNTHIRVAHINRSTHSKHTHGRLHVHC